MRLIKQIELIKQLIFSIVIYLLLIFIYISRYQFNLSSLMNFGLRSKYYQPEVIVPNTVIFYHCWYDGQFNYYLLTDLFIKKNNAFEPFRYQRLLYPFLSYMTAFGNFSLLPLTFVLINLIAVALGMIYLYKILKLIYSNNQNYLLSVYALNIGFIISILNDLGTPLAIGLIIAGIYYFTLRKYFVSAFCFSLSSLCLENVFLVLAPLFLYLLFNKKFREIVILLFSLIPWVIVQVLLSRRFSQLPIFNSAKVIGFPFVGMTSQIFDIVNNLKLDFRFLLRELNVIPMMVLAIFVLIFSAKDFFKRRDLYSLILLTHAVFAICLRKETIWSHTITSSGRVLSGVFPFLILNYVQKKSAEWKIGIYFSIFLSFMGIIRIFFLPKHAYFLSS